MRISYWSSDVVLFRSFDGYSVGAIDCTADRRFAYSFRDGARLASQHRLVEARSPFKNVAVHRPLGARTDQHVVARHQGRDRDILGRAIGVDARCGVGTAANERLQRALRPPDTRQPRSATQTHYTK